MLSGGPQGTWFDLGAVARDAPILEGGHKMPMVVLSHGTGGSAASMGWLARRLAVRGYVVLAVDHHGNTAVEPYRAEGFLCWWERARDLSELLDQVATDTRFAGCLDSDRVFAIGFSLGCHSALSLLGGITDLEQFRTWAEQAGDPLARGPREFPDLASQLPRLWESSAAFRESWQRSGCSYRDPRVKAALLLAPAPTVRAFSEASLRSVEAMLHIVAGDADTEAPARYGADWVVDRLTGVSVERLGPAVGHYVFLPEGTEVGRSQAPALCIDGPGVDRRAIHDAVTAAAIQLFNSTEVRSRARG